MTAISKGKNTINKSFLPVSQSSTTTFTIVIPKFHVYVCRHVILTPLAFNNYIIVKGTQHVYVHLAGELGQ